MNGRNLVFSLEPNKDVLKKLRERREKMKNKIRSSRSAMKRFKVTGTGKLVAYGANHSHHLEKKSTRRKKRMK